MYVCIVCVCMYTCVYVYMYVCACMYICMYCVCMYTCMYICMHYVCTYVCMYVLCMCVCMYVMYSVYECICMYGVCMYVCKQQDFLVPRATRSLTSPVREIIISQIWPSFIEFPCLAPLSKICYEQETTHPPLFFYLTYSLCTHFAATCSRPPGAAVPRTLPTPSSALCVYIHVEVSKKGSREKYDEHAICTVTNSVSARHGFTYFRWLLSLSLCRHLRKSWTEVYFRKQTPDLTSSLCRPQPQQLSDHNSLLFRLISLFVNPYICLWPRTLCQETKSVSSFTFLILVPFSNKI